MDDPNEYSSTGTSPSTPRSPLWSEMGQPASSPAAASPENDPGTIYNAVVPELAQGQPDANGVWRTKPIKGAKDGSISVEVNPVSRAAEAANFTSLITNLTTLLTNITTAIGAIPTIAHGDAATILLDSPFSTIGISGTYDFRKDGGTGTGYYRCTFVKGLLQSIAAET